MNGILTVSFRNSSQLQQAVRRFQDQTKSIEAYFLPQEFQKIDQLIYEVTLMSKSQRDRLQQKINQISRIYDTEISCKFSLIEVEQNSISQKITSQENMNQNKQFSNSNVKVPNQKQKMQRIKSNKIQEMSVSSDQFQLLQEEDICQLVSKKNTDTVLQKSEDQICKTKSQEGFQYIGSVSQNNLLQLQSSSQNVCFIPESQCLKQKNSVQNSKKTYEALKRQQETDQRQYSGQFDLTNEQLLKYFSGKDDYTQVFKLNSEQNIQQKDLSQEISEKQQNYNQQNKFSNMEVKQEVFIEGKKTYDRDEVKVLANNNKKKANLKQQSIQTINIALQNNQQRQNQEQNKQLSQEYIDLLEQSSKYIIQINNQKINQIKQAFKQVQEKENQKIIFNGKQKHCIRIQQRTQELYEISKKNEDQQKLITYRKPNYDQPIQFKIQDDQTTQMNSLQISQKDQELTRSDINNQGISQSAKSNGISIQKAKIQIKLINQKQSLAEKIIEKQAVKQISSKKQPTDSEDVYTKRQFIVIIGLALIILIANSLLNQ